jgi:hypothetical protein
MCRKVFSLLETSRRSRKLILFARTNFEKLAQASDMLVRRARQFSVAECHCPSDFPDFALPRSAVGRMMCMAHGNGNHNGCCVVLLYTCIYIYIYIHIYRAQKDLLIVVVSYCPVASSCTSAPKWTIYGSS